MWVYNSKSQRNFRYVLFSFKKRELNTLKKNDNKMNRNILFWYVDITVVQ